MELWEVIAREHIRATINRYAHCADTGRFDDLVNLFAPDGSLEIAGRDPLVGRGAIRAFLTGTKADLAASTSHPLIRHHVASIDIDVHDRDRATARSYFFVITERGPDHWGRYRDDLVRRDELWLFQRRVVRPEGHAPGSWAS
jgi:hypothetical protein